jgi:hypothetical protein
VNTSTSVDSSVLAIVVVVSSATTSVVVLGSKSITVDETRDVTSGRKGAAVDIIEGMSLDKICDRVGIEGVCGIWEVVVGSLVDVVGVFFVVVEVFFVVVEVFLVVVVGGIEVTGTHASLSEGEAQADEENEEFGVSAEVSTAAGGELGWMQELPRCFIGGLH